MADTPLDFLVRWFTSQRDGDWEHQQGVVIDTLDNPGWSVKVDLLGTELEGLEVEMRKWEESEHVWLSWWSSGQAFEAACGPGQLNLALQAFEDFARRHRPHDPVG